MKLDKSSNTNNVELRIVACVVSKCALERHTPGRYCVFDFEVKIATCYRDQDYSVTWSDTEGLEIKGSASQNDWTIVSVCRYRSF